MTQRKTNPAHHEPDRLFGARSYGPQLDWLICRKFTSKSIKQSICEVRVQRWMNSVKVGHLIDSAHCTFYCLRPIMRIAQGSDFSDSPWNNPLPSVFSFQRLLPLIRKTKQPPHPRKWNSSDYARRVGGRKILQLCEQQKQHNGIPSGTSILRFVAKSLFDCLKNFQRFFFSYQKKDISFFRSPALFFPVWGATGTPAGRYREERSSAAWGCTAEPGGSEECVLASSCEHPFP